MVQRERILASSVPEEVLFFIEREIIGIEVIAYPMSGCDTIIALLTQYLCVIADLAHNHDLRGRILQLYKVKDQRLLARAVSPLNSDMSNVTSQLSVWLG